MKYNKELLELVRKGEATEAELIQNLMAVNPLQDIMMYAVQALIKNVEYSEPSKISVTMEEYERITSIFKIKGYKTDPETGELIAETRGRKSKE